MDFYAQFPYITLSDMGIEQIHTAALSEGEFHESLYNERHTLLDGRKLTL
jgi:hypothetical protein